MLYKQIGMGEEMNAKAKQIIDNMENVIIGKRGTVTMVLLSLICGGHILIEDVPGVGKTSIVSALAKSLNLSFRRIQFTPDILPSDITGFSMYNPKTNDFEYREGLVMSSIILADEINRTSPKTQSSLLEVMEEGQVTVDGQTRKVPEPFIVLATQNPIEHIGTYPLPEAQLDRFFIKLSVGYPTGEEESRILDRFEKGDPFERLSAVASGEDIMQMKREALDIAAEQSLKDYIVSVIAATRTHPDVLLGASPRGTISLFRAAQGCAYLSGRSYILPDDIKRMAPFVLSHRLILKQDAKLRKLQAESVVADILSSIEVPVIRKS